MFINCKMKFVQQYLKSTIISIAKMNGKRRRWRRQKQGLRKWEVFEKAGVNVSVVHGTLSPEAAEKMGGGHQLKGQDLEFFATGISLVLHPKNPMAPTVHANYRYFERGLGEKEGSWWFGGGLI